MDLVKEQYKRTGGSNGFKTYKAAETLGISDEELSTMIKKLLDEKKIVYLYPLNGRTITLPK
ncbi:hypothetical protein [Chryseobacterium sp.]|uniref:hypothetical protein n=1 Tax=Chryseobacterium sp. TaxID=1871047 RepID=UPI0024E21D32|nr:hypothetical protein [Chryseobacterium sp.]